MALKDIDFNAIRPVNRSKDNGFEEFICQLAKSKNIPNGKYTRNGTPDGGVECYWALPDGTKWAWQAKYFQTSLGASQFQQIEKSIKTALTNDSNIVKYFIAIPIDPPSSIVEGRSNMKIKWDNHISKWKELYPKVDIIPWWKSDIITILQDPKKSSFVKFWFDKTFLDDSWFDKQNEIAICDLGPRYTPEINVDIDSSMIFDGIEKNQKIINLYGEKLDSFSSEFQNLLRCNFPIGISLNEIKLSFDKLIQNYSDIVKSVANKSLLVDFENIRNIVGKFKEEIYKLYSVLEECKSILEDKTTKNFNDFRDCFNRTNNKLDGIESFINSYCVKLYQDPFLLLIGDAGIGKSHQIAHYVEDRNKRGLKSVLLLGQKFIDARDPKIQILEQLDLNCTFEEFLEALSCRAEIDKNRIIIFLDAINEGRGHELWRDNLNGLVSQIKQYKNLGFVLSLRSTYLSLFDDLIKEFNKYQLNGFCEKYNDAINVFFKYYKIRMPIIPLLNPEFFNPLFLKLFCEGLNKHNIHSFSEKICDIDYVFKFYIDAINKSVFKQDSDLNILKIIIEKLIEQQIQTGKSYFEYNTIAKICIKSCQDYGIKNPLRELISEGLLFEDCYGSSKYVRFSYERLNDFLLAEYIITKNKHLDMKYVLRVLRHPMSYQGFFDALAILLPIHRKKEIFEYLKSPKLEEVVVYSFIKSLSWRKTDNFNSKHSDFINNVAIKYKNLLFDALIVCASNPNNYFNANKTHNYLMQYSLAERDSTWTLFLHNCKYDEGSPINRLIDWVFYEDEKSNIPDDVIELTSTILGWFLVSQNRTLRDRTTKALVYLLKDKPNIMIKILRKFENVNDSYVAERLYAVAYGVVLRTNNLSFLHELCIYVYNVIFNQDEIYPNILLRDYARGIIEYAISNEIHLDIDKSKIIPPYRSKFPKIPTDEEINEYKVTPTKRIDHHLWGIQKIFDSMLVERDRDGNVNWYGDFGRYIFQHGITSFKHDYENRYDFISDMHNIAIKRIFDLGYNGYLHGEFDNRIATGYYRGAPNVERVGKKYQWIAYHELLAYLSDKYEIAEDSWSNKSSGYLFSGPWEMHARDIDPSYIGNFCEDNIISETQYNLWGENNAEWIKAEEDFPDPKNIISGNSNDWLLLRGFLSWNKPKKIGIKESEFSFASLFYLSNGYFVNNRDADRIKLWLESKDFSGRRWLPEVDDINQMFIGEYAWRFDKINKKEYNVEKCRFVDQVETDEYEDIVSVNFDEIIRMMYGEAFVDKPVKEKGKLQRQRKICEKVIGQAFYTTMGNYYSSSDRDFSLNKDSIHVPQPCRMLFDYFKLHRKKYENTLYDKKNELVCFSHKYNLYFKRDKLIEFLQHNDMGIIWAVLAEKTIAFQGKSKPNINTLSGVYSLSSKNEVVGTYKHTLNPIL